MSKSHSLNLYNLEDGSEKFEIDVTTAKIDVKTGGSKSIVLNMPLKLIDSSGNVDSVSTKIHSIDTAIASGNAVSATATALVQSNLTAYVSSNDTSLATVSATVTTNKAISDANHSSDAAARVQLESDVTALISTEETTRISDVASLDAKIDTEILNRLSGDASESSARQSGDLTLTNNLASCQSQVDGILAGSSVNLDSFLEVVNQYSSLNTSALAQIASLQTQLTALQAQVTELTDP